MSLNRIVLLILPAHFLISPALIWLDHDFGVGLKEHPRDGQTTDGEEKNLGLLLICQDGGGKREGETTFLIWCWITVRLKNNCSCFEQLDSKGNNAEAAGHTLYFLAQVLPLSQVGYNWKGRRTNSLGSLLLAQDPDLSSLFIHLHSTAWSLSSFYSVAYIN